MRNEKYVGQVIVGPRQSGRTSRIIEMAKKEPQMIVAVHDEETKDILRLNNIELDHRIVTYDEILSRPYKLRDYDCCLAVDNAEHFIARVLGVDPSELTVSLTIKSKESADGLKFKRLKR